MQKVKVATLTGYALAWAVADALNWIEPVYGIGSISEEEGGNFLMMMEPDPDDWVEISELRPNHFDHYTKWSPDRLKCQYATLLEKFNIGVARYYPPIDGEVTPGCEWAAISEDDTIKMEGDSPGQAISRVVVALHKGLEVEVPDHVLIEEGKL